MSWEALSWAAKCRVGRAADKLILLGLAERHNPESGYAYPSVAWLADFGSLDRKTVMAALDRLEAANIISDSGERAGKTLQVKCYRLHLQTVPKTEQSQKRNSAVFSAKQSQKRNTDTVREPVPSEAKASSGKARVRFLAPPNVPEPVWRDFLESPKRRKAGMSGTAYQGICNNLITLAEHGFPPGEMIALAVERGWTTVKLAWVQNEERKLGYERADPNPTGTALARVQAALGGGSAFSGVG